MTLSFSYVATLINFKVSYKDAYKKRAPLAPLPIIGDQIGNISYSDKTNDMVSNYKHVQENLT